MTEADDDIDAKGQSAGRIWSEVATMYGAALVLVLGWVLLADAVAFVARNLYALVAVVFVGLPYWWLSRKEADFERFGLTWKGARRGLVWGLAASALTVAPFAVGYWWWQEHVQDRQVRWSTDNLYQWPVELDGRPSEWAEPEGLWVWADGPVLHIGLRADKTPLEVELLADEDFEPNVRGRADLEPLDAEAKQGYRLRIEPRDPDVWLSLGADGARAPPRSLTIEARYTDGDSVPVYRGADGAEVDAPLELDRGLNWMLLWALTHLVFIAFPEEFFYRGYLQTRLGDALEGLEGRRFLGISAANLFCSLLFALGHLLIPIGGALMISRASVFFPSLVFGWLRERTDTIAAPVVYHAAANLMVLFLAPHFF